MLLCQHRSHQPARSRPVREDPHHIRPSADLLIEPFQRVVGPDLPPVRYRERREGQDIRTGLCQHRGGLREPVLELVDHPVQLRMHLLGRRLVVDGAHHRGHRDRAGVTFSPNTNLPESTVFGWQTLTIQDTIEDTSRMASGEVEEILEKARAEAGQLGRSAVEPRDILLALVREAKGVSATVFGNLGVDLAAARSTLERLSDRGGSVSDTTPEMSEASLQVMSLARMEAHVMFHGRIEAEHLLLGLVQANDRETQRILRELGIEFGEAAIALRKALNAWRATPPDSPGQTPG